MIWPLETIKNLTQSAKPFKGASLKEKINYIGGLKGLYRGCGIGTLNGGIRNGFGIIAMTYAQRWATQLGLRK